MSRIPDWLKIVLRGSKMMNAAPSQPMPVSNKELFISHASADKHIVDAFVDFLVLGIGVNINNIFCTSSDGLGIPLGEEFDKHINNNLITCKIGITLISANYFKSLYCLSELKALHKSSKRTIHILIPPLLDIKDTIFIKQMMVLTNKSDLDAFRDEIKKYIKPESVGTARWNIKRDSFVNSIQVLLRDAGSLSLVGSLNSHLNISCLSKDKQPVNQLCFIQSEYQNVLLLKYLGNIEMLIDKIKTINIPLINNTGRNSDKLLKFVSPLITEREGDIGDERKTIVRNFINSHKLVIIDDAFFNVGELKWVEQRIADYYGGGKWQGTADEILKGELLRKLAGLIEYTMTGEIYLSFFDSIYQLNLIMSNTGKTYDEDITVSLKIPKGVIISLNEIKLPGRHYLEAAIDMMGYLFKQSSTSEIDEYPDYPVLNYPSQPIYVPSQRLQEGQKAKYLMGKYQNTIESIYQYEIFTGNEYDTVKYHQKYLKHNNKTHFPGTLFFKNKFDKIEYEINSKKCSEIMKGELISSK